jgi:hypothetical protein
MAGSFIIYNCLIFIPYLPVLDQKDVHGLRHRPAGISKKQTKYTVYE